MGFEINCDWRDWLPEASPPFFYTSTRTPFLVADTIFVWQ
jgi:hypothetical protein